MRVPLAVVRFDDFDPDGETEIAVVERQADRVVITLDDGSSVDFNAWELVSATAHPVQDRRAA
jgi:hypothetical protein